MSAIATPKVVKTVLHEPKDHTLTLLEHPAPRPTSSQYLIRVYSTTFTAGELEWPEPNALKNPIPGFDLAGEVIHTPNSTPPEGVSWFPTGARVYGLTSFSRHGNARSITVAEHSELHEIPDGMDLNTAASIPLSALTAWQALFVHAGLKPIADANSDKRVLVTAASGGVGIWVTQLASWAGAIVVGTCSSKNADFVKSLGADRVLDYTTQNLSAFIQEDPARQFDIIIDCVGGKTLEEAWTLVKENGFITSIALPPDLKKPSTGVNVGVKSKWFIVEPSGEQLGELGELIQHKTIKPQVDSIWSLEQYQQAWNRVKNGHVSGKVVIQVGT
ncbi:zinc-binding oxidoreductase [Microthyrium microscopicum]|uniref:Zinc-binding oxidoreductase n=1 Tax=Microthyrium microscopicum TaxID=703497 RepID=A0A6A6U511_9PEZI|nr:zinc-binding oxidoreductase [Microthyrium microscopicum]